MKTRHLGALIALALTVMSGAAMAAEPSVKLSKSGICHDTRSSSYKQTRNFEGFGSMIDCLKHGRAYRGYQAEPSTTITLSTHGREITNVQTLRASYPDYDRDLYEHWTDDDRNCRNTRHDLLAELSTGNNRFTKDGCAIVSGRWIDPYTNRIFTNARDLDIDHIVPLAWAHARGGYAWSAEQRRAFGNDKVNLMAVDAVENREKGAKGPLEWLPPNQRYQCEYVTRFHRVVLTYRLEYRDGERQRMDALRARLCS